MKSKKTVEDEIIFEEEGGDTSKAKIKKLQDKIKKLEAEKREYSDALQRAKADFVNMRKRDEISKLAFEERAGEKVILELLPILDSIEEALKNLDDKEETLTDFKKGLTLIHSQFVDVLKRLHVHPFNPLGEKFNPNEHTAIAIIETKNEKEDDIIANVIQKGYKFKDKIIRSAKVEIKQIKL